MKYTWDNITSSITQVRMDVIKECKTNAFAVRGLKANYIIDTGFGSETSRILSNFINAELDTYVINTHFHWDHIWGNASFESKRIVQHINCKPNIDKYWDEMYLKYLNYKMGEVENVYPDVVFDSFIDINNEIYLFHSPGHTSDCISAFFPKHKALFVGDNFGDNDSEIIPVLDCSPDLFLESLKTYEAMKPDIILSGHNEVRGVDSIKKMIDKMEMLQ